MSYQEEKYITLKEASQISGYAPDYIGQLIRKGKLPGKQVYHTIAWMTTEKVLKEYMQKERRKKGGAVELGSGIHDRIIQLKNSFFLQLEIASLFKRVLYVVIFLSVGFSLLLFYVFSVSFEKKLQEHSLESASAMSAEKVR